MARDRITTITKFGYQFFFKKNRNEKDLNTLKSISFDSIKKVRLPSIQLKLERVLKVLVTRNRWAYGENEGIGSEIRSK